MIFVTVGSMAPFEELVKAVDEAKGNSIIKDDVMIQIGNAKYIPKHAKYFRLDPNFSQYLKKAKIVIAHGGAGITYETLALGKKLISVNNPNLSDKHQEDILKRLSKDKHLMWCDDVNKLANMLKDVNKFKFKKYNPPKCLIADKIISFLK